MFIRKKTLARIRDYAEAKGYSKGREDGERMKLDRRAEELASSWAEIGKPAMLVEIENLTVENKQLKRDLLIAHDRIDQLKFSGGK